MQDRFKLILEEKGLTAQKIAKLIGIDASAVSHLLNGRRRPGFEVLDKIGQAFPDINLNWLITGKGEIHNTDQPLNIPKPPIQQTLFDDDTRIPAREKKTEPEKEIPSPITPVIIPTGKTIKRIVLFFSDGSFEDYTNP